MTTQDYFNASEKLFNFSQIAKKELFKRQVDRYLRHPPRRYVMDLNGIYRLVQEFK
jgi:hypothetical protein